MIFLNNIETRGFGVKVTGVSLILLGIHGIDFAFFRQVEAVAPLGYFIDALLRCIIAIGTLLVYFEKTRSDLTRKEEYYRLLTENAVDAIYRYRLFPQPGFEYISPSIEAITGYSPDEYYADAQLLARLVHLHDRHLFQDFAKVYSSVPLTLRLIRKDGREIWIEQKCAPAHSKNGQVQVVEGILRDATVRKQLEREISRHDRLNTVGEMAANLAHEIRNPMTTVRGYLQMLSGRHELTGYRGQFDLMVEELDRANSIICEYLSFCKDKVVDIKLCQMNKIIEAIVPLIQAGANAANSRVELDLADIPEIYIDEKEIRQVILNLARNGLEAMPSGGTLTIRTYTEEGRMILAIQDQGTGIPTHVLEKLGTPFFTTKEMGTGLGLAVCYRIANRYKAAIKVKTNSEGTTFLLHFALPGNDESMQAN
jgi:PAS domain S-box-containing protein